MLPSSADIHRNSWPVEPCKSVNLYLGTGRCGGAFDSYGLQHQGDDDPTSIRVSKTRLAHAEVWHRGKHGIDTQVPLTRLIWSFLPETPSAYRQELQLADGRLDTHFASPGFNYTLTLCTSPDEADRDLLCFHLSWSGTKRPALCVEPVRHYASDYSGDLAASTELSFAGSRATFQLNRGTSSALCLVHARGHVDLETEGDRLYLRLTSDRGEALIHLALGPRTREPQLHAALDRLDTLSWAQIQEHSVSAWTRRWGKSPAAPLGLPDHLSALYWRSHYHLLCTYAPDRRCPPPPMGFSGNGWGYHFPQDLSYVHPALLAHGHSDITRAHVEFYHSRLEDQLRLTRDIYQRPGVCWSWEFPIGPAAQLFRPEDGGAPNDFQFEVNNAAYPARLAIETAAALGDASWSRDIAWPIVRESARFLASCLNQEEDGSYSFFVSPSMGQDEFGGRDAKNYLCALFATEYTLENAVLLARQLNLQDQESAAWEGILKLGLSYKRLLVSGQDFYAANESRPFVPRAQKHPVQLNPLWLLPLQRSPDAATLSAYQQRRLVCSSERDSQRHGGVPTGFYDGWTLFAFQLSAATLGDAVGYAHELREMLPARAIDPDFITIYESSGYWQPYYTTSMGLFMQAARKGAQLLGHSGT